MMERALLERRQQLLGRVARLEGDLGWLQSNVDAEQIEEAERALAGMLERLDTHERAELTAIDHALARMRRGRYGFCEGCAEPILPARQQALCTATLCHVCAQAYEAHHRR